MDNVNTKIIPGEMYSDIPEMEGNKDVFISYKRENALFVIRVYRELEKNGVKAWLDLDRLHREPGAEYLNRIHKGIDQSELFLLIYTQEVENSEFIIENELKYAISKKKTILFYPQEPLAENSRLKEYVKDLQWLDTAETAFLQIDTQESFEDERKKFELSALTNLDCGFSIYDDQNLFLIRIALQRKLNRITQFGTYEKLCGVKSGEFYNNDNFQLIVENIGLFLSPPLQYKEQLKKFYDRNNKVVEQHIARCNIDKDILMEGLVRFLRDNAHCYSMIKVAEWFKTHLSSDLLKRINLPKSDELTMERFIEIVTEITACRIIDDMNRGILMFNGTELGVYDIKDNRSSDIEIAQVEMHLYYSDYFTFKCMTEMYHILCSIDGAPFNNVAIRNIGYFAPFLCSLGLGGFLMVNNKGSLQLLWTKRSKAISSGDTWHFSYDETVSLLKDSPGGNESIKVADDGKVHLSTNDILYRALKEELGVDRGEIEKDHHGIFEIGLIKSERLEVELISSVILHRSDKETPIENQIKEMHDASADGYLEVSKIKLYPLKGMNHLIGKLINPEALEASKRLRLYNWENVGKLVKIGENTMIEPGSYIDDGAEIGKSCKLHRNVYVGKNVKIGNNVKIQNNNSIYPGVTLCDGVFVGTNVSFVNDRYPRAIRKSDGKPVDASDWKLEPTVVKEGASIGSGAVILCGVTIGEWAMVGCGAVVTKDVPPFTTVVGNPAHPVSSDNL